MEVRQINLKLPENLVEAAESYVKNFGFRNIQELAAESIREKVFEKNQFDENFSDDEIRLIDNLIEKTMEKKDFGTEEELRKILKNEV
ncbi:hypothetical protein HOD75_02325 [archaeon]|jgi:hypothetical protein|nr:hypothetical protein [archaeon]MBT4241714.1 hypothetical protein [archaeon]MBT4418262.1 hypothetical protein [archaeon]